MAAGLLEITVFEAQGLPKLDFLSKIDPYVVLNYKGQEKKTSIARGQGSHPVWNETLLLRAEYPGSGSNYNLVIKVWDHDTFSSDDYIGQTTIHLEDLLSLGVEKGSYELRPTKYRLVGDDDSYRGELKIGVKFTCRTMKQSDDAVEFGGWKDSEY